MTKYRFGSIALFIGLAILWAIISGCGQQSNNSPTPTPQSTLSGTVKVPAGLISSGLRTFSSDGVSDTALAGATVIAIDFTGKKIAGTNTALTDANGAFTITNIPVNTVFYIKATKEVSSNIILVKGLASLETATKTGEELNALSSLTAQRVDNILKNTGLVSFESMKETSPVDAKKLLDFQIGKLASSPTLKGASESKVITNLLTTYNSLTGESSSFRAIDRSVDSQLLVGAASSDNEYKTAAWKFFEAAGFGVPTVTIGGTTLQGHGGLTSAMPTITDSVLDTVSAYLKNGYRWNIPKIVTALNQVAGWKINYTQTSSETSTAQSAPLLPAILNGTGGSVSHYGVINTSQTYTVIEENSAPNIVNGAFGCILYGAIPSYEGFVATIRNLERPLSPSWEIPSIIAVTTLAFPLSFWDINPASSSGKKTFDENTQLDILQSYAMIYNRMLKIEGLNNTPGAPYYNHSLRLQFADRPNIEAEMLQYLLNNKI